MASALRASILRHIRMPASRSVALNRYCSTSCLTEEEIAASALDVVQTNSNIKSVDLALKFATTHPKTSAYSLLDQLRVTSRVLDDVSKYPLLEPREVFCARLLFRCMLGLTDEKQLKDLTRDEVASKVLELIKICPNVDPSKVTKDTHFEQDLKLDRFYVIFGMRVMFRLNVLFDAFATNLETVEDAVDYVYGHLHETWSPNQEGLIYVNYIDKLSELSKA